MPPTAKIEAAGISVELEANETSIDALGKQAMKMLRQAKNITGERTVGFGPKEGTE